MKKIVSLKQLPTYKLSARARVEGLQLTTAKTIVLATGCFDILHPEHKKFLKAAKKQGDILIVGLESDKRVKKLKGKNRPINSWKIRAKHLAQLRWVDFVFPLPEKFDSPKQHLQILQLIKPNILAVSENTPFIKEKGKLMKKIGGKLKIVLFYNPKISTTKLLKES